MRLPCLVFAVLPLAACSLQRSPIIDRDAPAIDARLLDAPRPDGSTCDPSACNDGNPCTDDRCGASGCEHVPNTAACDDGLFCTSGDECSAGTCGGGRETCPFCDEASNSCGACTTDADCPGATVGTCAYADVCATTGTMSSTSFRCEGGACVADTTSAPCTRTTDGTSCGTTVTSRGDCTSTGMDCTRGGASAVTTTSFVCGAGVCATRSMVATEACDHEPTGDSCQTCTDGACMVPMGSCTGAFTRSCGIGTCAGAVCLPGSTDTTERVSCTAAAGTICATSVTCGSCERSGGPGCGATCSYVAGSCAGAICNAGSAGTMTGRLPCPCP